MKTTLGRIILFICVMAAIGYVRHEVQRASAKKAFQHQMQRQIKQRQALQNRFHVAGRPPPS